MRSGQKFPLYSAFKAFAFALEREKLSKSGKQKNSNREGFAKNAQKLCGKSARTLETMIENEESVNGQQSRI